MSALVSFLTTAFAFVLLLTVLVFVHELGHFLAARWCGVRVLKFSIGFGKPIGFGNRRLAWTRGDTEYVVGWLPLGGYVKMLGENIDEIEDPEVRAQIQANPGESLPEKNTWQKLLIVFAGPIANLILPVVVFMGTLAVGMPRPEAVVGSIEPGSPAAEAGLQAGDRITQVAEVAVPWWGDLEDTLRGRAGREVTVAYERDGAPASTQLSVGERAGVDPFGQVVQLGWAGIDHRRRAALLGITETTVPAAVAGLRSGEVVEAVGATEVEDWSAFAAAYAAVPAGTTTAFRLRMGEGEEATHREVTVPALGSPAALGVQPANVLISTVSPDSAASEAGLQPRDLILSVDGEPVGSFSAFADSVRTSGGESLTLQIARAGELLAIDVTPRLQNFDAGMGIEEPRYLVGISAERASLVGALGVDQELRPWVALPRAVGMTVEVTQTFLQGLGKLVTGEVSRKQLAGPIGIAEIAGNAFERGWETYLSIMVLISINLGILNLLPIPILDGGQAVIFALEGILRAPLSIRTREIAQQVGFTMLMLLMGLAFWNDLTRQWTRLIDWLSGA
ncbi:MAG: RIP metalloprotease RseP [Myxococcota bacterium]